MLYLFFLWVPWEVDLFPRKPPNPNPRVDPEIARLFSPGSKVLLVTAHPDDSAFYIGGFLHQLGQSGAEVHQLICTDGDKTYYGIFADAAANRKVRREEALEELQAWGGKDLYFLGFPDGRLRSTDDLVARIRAYIDTIKPDYVICFDGDYPTRFRHGDHRHSGVAAERAAKGAPSVKWVMRFSTIGPNYVRDISDDWEEQQKLLKIHKSQFYGERLERVTEMVESRALDEGFTIGKTYGEGFRCSELK